MPTKTDRILSYLPRTFRAFPRPTALYSVVDAFGSELLQGENSLAAVMQAHWVDHADRGAEVIDDLARIAAMYGLAPRSDESVEEFREHLKRYIRTFLEGTVTVQGVLRVTAETLGLRIADDYADLDTWWTRDEGELLTIERRGDDAAELVLGVEAATMTGSPARPAQVTGKVDLSGGVDLRDIAMLHLRVNDEDPVRVNLAQGIEDPASVQLDKIVERINDTLRAELGEEYESVADSDGNKLTLTSPTIGPDSRLEVQAAEDDAADRVLGLAPRIYRGREARAARVTGTDPLSNGIDLSEERYLRLFINGTHLAEIDCADPDNPTQTTLDQVRDAINDAFDLEADVASHDGWSLTLASPTTGFQSTVAFQRPAAQDATTRLFGAAARFHNGQDAQPARLTGRPDLSGGVDLSERSFIQLTIDGQSPEAPINCAGADPANTQPSEIADAINAAFENLFADDSEDPVRLASHNGRLVTVTSPTVGPDGIIMVETPPSEDATEDIFGIGPRTFEGADATTARLVGKPDLQAGVNLRARRFLKLAVDGGTPVEIDLRTETIEPGIVLLDELADAIDSALGANVASHDGQHLVLTSPTTGSASSLVIEPLETTQRRRFVTRAIVTDEATQAILGFIAREAHGTPATSARIVGERDLSRGVDLREARYLRLVIDNHPPVDVDCAGKRPRATLIHEVVDAINDKLQAELPLDADVASHDGQHLILTSPTEGAGSRIAIEPPRATDALDKVLGVEPGTYRGEAATGINFVGTVDLSDGFDLDADAAIKLGIDDAGPVEITLGDTEPAHKALNQLVIRINQELNQKLGVGNVATSDGQHLILTLPPDPEGKDQRKLVFDIPGNGPDVTAAIFGISPPRSYQSAAASPAKIVGARDLTHGVDLPPDAALEIGVDPSEPEPVFLTGSEPTRVTLSDIVGAVNDAFEQDIASEDGTHLVLTSPTAGLAGRITLELHTSGDASETLLGDVEELVQEGATADPAVIEGKVDLLAPVDVSERRWIRLAVDGDRPVDIDVAGAAPATTFLDEIVETINGVFHGLASATEEDRLKLTSPTAGEDSHLSALPLRYVEVIEYPPEPTEYPPEPRDEPERQLLVRHGDDWQVHNDGAADVFAQVDITVPDGVSGPMLVNTTLGWRVRLHLVVGAGETIRLQRDTQHGLQAEICSPEGDTRPVPTSQILVGPLGAQAWVPAKETWHLSGDEPASLQLNNPTAPSIVVLHARQNDVIGHKIAATVVESDLGAVASEKDAADGSSVRRVGRVRAGEKAYTLVDGDETEIARLRAGPNVQLTDYEDCVVAVTGELHAGEPPLLIVQELVRLFDVLLRFQPRRGEAVEEFYPGVTIGDGAQAPDALVRQVAIKPSQLVKAEELDKGTVLSLPRGLSNWIHLECHASRFNYAKFNSAYFSGGLCYERAVFDVSRFARGPLAVREARGTPATSVRFVGKADLGHGVDLRETRYLRLAVDAQRAVEIDCAGTEPRATTIDEIVRKINRTLGANVASRDGQHLVLTSPTRGTGSRIVVEPSRTIIASDARDTLLGPGPEPEAAVFGSSDPVLDRPAEAVFRWERHKPGAFVVNLPADLPARFGSRFNEARFVQGGAAAELYEKVVTEPPDDEDFLVDLIKTRSTLVQADVVAGPRPPLGWEPVQIPFRKPRFLTLGTDGTPARIYLAEEGVDGLIELRAREPGSWGNEIAVAVRQSGPAMYDVSILYHGACFENARKVALGKDLQEPGLDLPAQVQKLLQPGPIGVLQAKAAGVQAKVARDRAECIR